MLVTESEQRQRIYQTAVEQIKADKIAEQIANVERDQLREEIDRLLDEFARKTHRRSA